MGHLAEESGAVDASGVEHIAREQPAFHLLLGDYSYANGKQPVWDEWLNLIEPMTRSVPLMAALGNHENETIDGKKVHQIGVPWHWGYKGVDGLPGSKGDITNDLSSTVGDPNVYIQETKAFLCNVKKGVV